MKKWYPIHLLWEWSEGPGEPQIVSLVVSLPSGVKNNKGSFSLWVNNQCMGLTICATWPNEIINTKEVHKWVIEGKRVLYHPRLMMFEKALSVYRAHQSESITSTATIPLPFKVLKKIRMSKRLGFNDSIALFIYVNMEADKRSDYIEDNDDTIEIL